MEPWDSNGLLAVGIIIEPAKSSDFTVLWAGRYWTYELVENLEVVQERRRAKTGAIKRINSTYKTKNLYDTYIVNRIKKLPYVTGKIAISKNRLIYSEGIKRITDKSSDKITHYLRYKNDSIMISSKTLNTDNPKLNCRLKGFESFSPRRIILDRNLKMKINSYIFKSTKKKNTIIFHNSSDSKKIQILKKKGITLIKSKVDNNKLFDLRIILKKLYILGTRNLLVEGGDMITKNLIKNRYVDKFYLFKSFKNIKTNRKHKFFTSVNMLNSRYRKKNKISSKLAKDNITIYKK